MKHKVLVVEDNATNRKLFQTLLRLAGHDVLEAEDAKTGIQLARDQRPELILMDIQLPGMDGFTATRLIKKDPDLKGIPVVALTAFAMLEDEEKAAEAGCDGFISKPIDTRNFQERIETFLTSGEGSAEVPPERDGAEYKSKILIVDDEPMNVKVLAAQLSSDRHEIMRAGSGPEALEKIAKRPPDVILLDIMMPGMDGFEVVRRVKSDPETRNIPIIMVTVLEERKNKEKALQAGADEFLNKPVNREELLSRINSMLCLKHCEDGLDVRRSCETSLKAGEAPEEDAPEEEQAAAGLLLIEDNDRDARLIRSYLEGEPCRLVRARDGEAARSCLAAGGIDLILLDILLPDSNGLEVCRQVKNQEETRNIQVVVVTCVEDMGNKVACLESGADEYLVKPIDPRELKARLRTLLKKKQHMDLLQSKCKIALDSAALDPVTGIYSHAYFRHFLRLEVKRSLRYQYPIALLLIGLDNAAKLREDLGPEACDGILKELAQVTARGFRETDLLARYAEDGFAVVLQYLDKKCAVAIAERLRRAIASHRFACAPALPAGGGRVRMGISFCPTDASTVETMIARAERSLNLARNREDDLVPDADSGPGQRSEDVSSGKRA